MATKSTPSSSSSARPSRSTSSASTGSSSSSAPASSSADEPAEVDYPGLRGTVHDPSLTADTATTHAQRDELAERDRTIAELRAQLAAINATPDGAATEMQRAVASLTAEVERMKAGAGLVAVPEPLEPDPWLYNVILGCGDRVDGQHPNATHHFCKEHGTQRVDRVFPKSVEQLAEQLA